jgi:hypothetical protein
MTNISVYVNLERILDLQKVQRGWAPRSKEECKLYFGCPFKFRIPFWT